MIRMTKPQTKNRSKEVAKAVFPPWLYRTLARAWKIAKRGLRWVWALAKRSRNSVKRLVRLALNSVKRQARLTLHFLKRALRRIFFVPAQLLIICKNIFDPDRPLSYLGRNSIYVDPKLSFDAQIQPDVSIGPEFKRSTSATAFIISYTGVSNEPRVLRQASALSATGWKVVVFGFEGNSANPPDWLFVKLPAVDPYLPIFRSWLLICRRNFAGLGRHLPFLNRLAASADFGFQHTGDVIVAEGQKLASIHGCDLILCHDYFTSRPALTLGKQLGVKVCLDAHEYATGQLMHDRQWRNVQRPIIQLVQKETFPQFDGVTTVSNGICDLLNKEYQLKSRCITIRSMPNRRAYAYRDVEERVSVLYHGNVEYIRGLHKAIKSMSLWPQEFDLIIRGYASPEYREDLEILVESLNLTHRVQFADPVPFNELIDVASEADIGYFVHKDLSPQKRFVLPNKFFEYIQAGLALCVSDLPSMAEIVKQHSLGVLVDDYSEEAIATAINSLTKDKIREFKQASIEAREELCWEKESDRLISYYDSIMTSR